MSNINKSSNLDDRKGMIVINATYAKELLKLGYHIIDIKPDRVKRERTVFVFEDNGDGKIHHDLETIIALNKH